MKKFKNRIKANKHMIVPYKGKQPQIETDTFVAPTAVVIGDVHIQSGTSIWYGVVIRGDMEPIIIGADTNIQDNCTIHTDQGHPAIIGPHVSIGHNAVIHGCKVGPNCLIGIGAIVLSGSRVGEGSVVAAGSVVAEGQIIDPGQIVAGIPARFTRMLTDADRIRFSDTVANYKNLSQGHSALFKRT
jgi:carbonic anhydrase/acetyltransferase-like protein (isoleucine patch superfamily)